jgi:hypothetical protein
MTEIDDSFSDEEEAQNNVPKVASVYESGDEAMPDELDSEAEVEFADLDDENVQDGAGDWVIAVVYSRTLKFIAISHPLFGCHYIGQAVRLVDRYGTTPQKLANRRWSEENSQAQNVNKRLGLLGVIRDLGADALEDQVIDFRVGHRRDVQPWADEQEKNLIAAYGGPLRDMHAPLRQTLNLSHGGKGFFAIEGRIALNNLKWRDFQLALTEYIAKHETAYVPQTTILPSGYKLGTAVLRVRRGHLWKGWPAEKERKAWLESLPNWVWKAYSEGQSRFFARMTHGERVEHVRKCTEFKRRPEARTKAAETARRQYANETGEQRNARIETKRNIARIKHEEKLAPLTEDERIKEQVKFQRSQDKHARRKRRLEALRRCLWWEEATMSDLPKAKAFGIVLDVCSCGVECKCKQGEGSSS